MPWPAAGRPILSISVSLLPSFFLSLPPPSFLHVYLQVSSTLNNLFQPYWDGLPHPWPNTPFSRNSVADSAWPRGSCRHQRAQYLVCRHLCQLPLMWILQVFSLQTFGPRPVSGQLQCRVVGMSQGADRGNHRNTLYPAGKVSVSRLTVSRLTVSRLTVPSCSLVMWDCKVFITRRLDTFFSASLGCLGLWTSYLAPQTPP